MKTKSIAAFFDFDGTLYNGVVAFDFLKYLFKNKILSLTDTLRLLKFLYYYALDKFGLADRHNINIKIYQKISGWDSKLLETNSKIFFKSEIRKKLIPRIVGILKKHKGKNHKVVIVTSALKEIMRPLGRFIKLNEVIATEVETKDGKYTERILKLPIGKNRAAIVKEYCNVHNIDIKKSYAYSDHYSDVALLESVGHPVATYPGKKLREYAIKNRWRIIDH